MHLQLTATIAHVGQTADQASNVDVISALRERGLRMTPQRRAIVAEIMRTQGHISPTALARKVQGDMPGVNASTIYRTLALLARSVASGHKHAARQFQKQGTGGSIISTASAAGLQGGWSSLGYTIAKHAVVGIVRQATADSTTTPSRPLPSLPCTGAASSSR